MEFSELAELIRRPAVRSYDLDRPVPPGAVEQIIEAARWTGSARNRQPWRFVEIRDRARAAGLASLGAYAQFIADAPVVLVVASADDGFADTAYDCGRITQSIVLAAATLGLGCCPATLFPDSNVETARRLLDLPTAWSPRHVLALGYPTSGGATGRGTSAVQRGRKKTNEVFTPATEPAADHP